MSGWIGVDLDGTLAEYNGWVGPDDIGDPILPMLQRVVKWIGEGQEVRIFTARVCEGPHAKKLVEDWAERHTGVRLEATNEKDYEMIQLWDDRAVRVHVNSGEVCVDCSNHVGGPP